MFDAELGPPWYTNPLTTDLYAERLAGFERVRQAAQFGDHFGRGVDALDVPRCIGHGLKPTHRRLRPPPEHENAGSGLPSRL